MTPVYTAIFSSQDSLKDEQIKGEFNYIAYMGKPIKSNTWEVRRAEYIFHLPDDNKLLYKFSPHLLFPKAKYSLWLEPGLSLHTNVDHIIEKEMKNTDVLLTEDMSFILRKNSIKVFDFDDCSLEETYESGKVTLSKQVDVKIRYIDPIYHN